MAKLTVRVSGLRKIDQKIITMVKVAPVLSAKVMFTSAHRITIPAIKARLKSQRNVFRGDLVQRQAARTGIEGGKPFIEIGALGVPYGLAVEKGQGPHKPNSKKILEYARKKMGLTKGAFAVAAAIIKTLQTTGSRPHPYLVPTWLVTRDAFFKDWLARMKIQFKKLGI
jgi:hypothetical protein